MIHIFRKNQTWLMVVITFLTIISFALLYNQQQLSHLASLENLSAYGQEYTYEVFQRMERNFSLAGELGQFQLASKLGGGGMFNQGSPIAYAHNLIILRHQASAYGIEPTDEQVASRIMAVPYFQKNGQFDRTKFERFVQDRLNPNGFNERDLEGVMRDSLRLEGIAAVVQAPVAVGEGEIREAAKGLRNVTGGYVRFDLAAVEATVQISPAQVTDVFEKNRANFRTPEVRVVRYVAFELPKDAKLEGKAKVEALQKLANRAGDLAESIKGQSSGLSAAASKAGLTVQTSVPFTAKGELHQKTDADPAHAAVARAVAPAAFVLATSGQSSDAIDGGDVFYVVELVEKTDSQPMTFEEARPLILEELRRSTAARLLIEKSEAQLKTIREAIAAGKSFADAAAQAGLKPETFENVAPVSQAAPADLQRILPLTIRLSDGEVGNFERAPWGGVAVYLKSRAPLDDKEFSKKKEEILGSLVQQKQDLLFSEWMRISTAEANVVIPNHWLRSFNR